MLATQSLNPYPPLPYSSASTAAAYASSGPLAAMSMYTTMQQQQQQQHHHHPQQSPYAFAQAAQQQQQAPPPRQYGTQGTSSAFSASANPDEDWTKISDLAERRRIQNRIAQRNYRKKLKRRLEDLERRAGSPDSTESQKPSPAAAKNNKRTPAATKVQKTTQKQQQPKQRQPSRSPVALSPPTHAAPQPTKPTPVPHMQFTPPMETADEFILPATYSDGRDPSHSPPPMYSSSYSSYPPPDELLLNPYSTAAQPYPTMVTADGGYASYLPTASAAPSTTIPPMTHFTDAFKRDSYASDSGISSYGGGYGFYPGMDVNGSSPYESNPHTPPLSHGFDHSANCSESGYEYPTTPLSMPGSPALVQQM